MELMKKQVLRFGVEMIDEDAEEAVFTPGGPFRIRSRSGWHEARTVIIATGASARWLNLPDEEKFRGRGISACAVCDGMFFRNQDVMVVGGGDTAIEEALTLARLASKVTIVHRRNELRAGKTMRQRAEREPRICFLWNTIITSYHGESALESVGLKDVVTGREWKENIAGVFMGIGHHPNTEFLKGALALDADGYIAVRNNVETSVDGVFAAGDAADRNYRQAITAAAFGCMAGLSAERWLGAVQK
jgi:thioredoxin reductase (NADPH)